MSFLDTFFKSRRAKPKQVSDSGVEVQNQNHISWKKIVNPPCDQIRSFWASKSNDIFVAGTDSIYHYDGQTWKIVYQLPYDRVKTYEEGLLDINGTGPDNVVAVGGYSSLGRVIHWNGNKWEALPLFGPPRWRSVCVIENTDIIVVPDQTDAWPKHYFSKRWESPGMTFLTTPSGWTPRNPGNLYAAWGSDSNNCYLVGSTGQIFHLKDSPRWEQMVSPTHEDIKAIWGCNPNDIFAVGDKGIILHYNGLQWTVMESPSAEELFTGRGLKNWTSICGSGPDDVFVAGWEGIILHYTDKVWTKVQSPTTHVVDKICCGSSGDVFLFAGQSIWALSR